MFDSLLLPIRWEDSQSLESLLMMPLQYQTQRAMHALVSTYRSSNRYGPLEKEASKATLTDEEASTLQELVKKVAMAKPVIKERIEAHMIEFEATTRSAELCLDLRLCGYSFL